jgi:hypothetical protein
MYMDYIETVFWNSTFTHEGKECIQKKNYNSMMEMLKNSEIEFPSEVLIPTEQILRDVID